MAEISISAVVGPHDILNAAHSAGFPGTESRATVIRYALYRAIGRSHDDAVKLARKQPLNVEAGMTVRGKHINAKVDEEVIREAEQILGMKDRSTTVRYALACAADYPPEEALILAQRRKGPQPKVLDRDP